MSQGSSGSAREAPDARNRGSSSSKRHLTVLPTLADSERAPSKRKSSGARPAPVVEPESKDAKDANVISLARARVLLWAHPKGDATAYEVSKAVHQPLQARCKTAPLCPGESPGDGLPGWIQPNAPPVGVCPYDYRTRGECIADRNIEALVAALFSPGEARRVANYLGALGYNVRDEEFAPESLDGTRILNAHARIGASHEVRVMVAPGVGEIVLVRDLAERR